MIPEVAAPAAAPAAAPSPKATGTTIGQGNREAAIAQLAKIETAAPESEGAASGSEPLAEPTEVAEAAPQPAKVDAAAAARKNIDERYAEFTRRTKELSATRGQREAAKQEAARMEQERAAHQRQIQAAQLADQDPWAYLESRGVTAEELVRRGITRGSPEAKIEAKLQELDQWKAEQQRAYEQAQKQAAAMQAQQAYVNARREFEAMVDKHSADFPVLAELAPDYVSYHAFQIAKQYYDDSGEIPDERRRLQILAYLEKTEHDARLERQKRRTPAAKSSGPQPGAQRKPTPPATAPKKSVGSLRDQRRERGLALLERAERS